MRHHWAAMVVVYHQNERTQFNRIHGEEPGSCAGTAVGAGLL